MHKESEAKKNRKYRGEIQRFFCWVFSIVFQLVQFVWLIWHGLCNSTRVVDFVCSTNMSSCVLSTHWNGYFNLFFQLSLSLGTSRLSLSHLPLPRLIPIVWFCLFFWFALYAHTHGFLCIYLIICWPMCVCVSSTQSICCYLITLHICRVSFNQFCIHAFVLLRRKNNNDLVFLAPSFFLSPIHVSLVPAS